jgi:hypothetical protein
MLKQPRVGRVKTRLGKDIGFVAATWWFRHQTRSLVRRLSNGPWEICLAVAPDRVASTATEWPLDIPRIPQGGGDLGDRMGRILRSRMAARVCIVGGDIPGIRAHHIARAFRALGANEYVLGPSPDGGYWLVGTRSGFAQPPSLFKDVRWSTEHTCSDTIRTFEGRSYALVDTLRDVDTEDDLNWQ